MRDISQLHPDLQAKITELQALCKKNKITIGIGECVRTVAEQDALYAKGRTASGSIVTNAKGSSYSSMHQWGVAFDFYLIMDVDGDGKTSDDSYNNATGLFDKVGKLGQSIGLEWGGSWKSIVDKPHFQLADWGSTTSTLKTKYGTPDKFKATWKKSSSTAASTSKTSSASTAKTESAESSSVVSYSKSSVVAATSKKASFAGTYTTTSNLNLRMGPGSGSKYGIIITIPKGKTVSNYGYYSKDTDGKVWYYVAYGKYEGYVHSSFVKKA